MKAHEEFLAWPALQAQMQRLETLLEQRDVEGTKDLLIELVSGYTPNDQGLETAGPDSRLRYSV